MPASGDGMAEGVLKHLISQSALKLYAGTVQLFRSAPPGSP